MDDLLLKLSEKTIKDLDLTKFDFSKNPINFTGKQLEGLNFSGNETLKDIAFNKAVIIDCNFERAHIDSCDFTNAVIRGTGDAKYASLKNTVITKSKFRGAVIDVCDFRYADISDSTFQSASFKYTDFYRTAFKGIIVFQEAKFESCSLNYVSFETFCITRDNLVKNKSGTSLVQESEEVYRDFLAKWIRLDINKNTMSIIDDGLAHKYEEAQRIYRQLSALWEEKGHNRDADWAYIQAKRMERKHLWYEKKDNVFVNKLKAGGNMLIDIFLGYGASMAKAFIVFLCTIFLFGIIYMCVLKEDPVTSLKMSMRYTIDGGNEAPDPVEFLSMLQTSLSMLLTGFMGFVVANKIRKS